MEKHVVAKFAQFVKDLNYRITDAVYVIMLMTFLVFF